MDKDDYDRIKPKEARKLIAQWAVGSWEKVHPDVVFNSWRHRPWSYFPDEDTVPTQWQDDDFDEDCSSSEDEEEDEDDLSEGEDDYKVASV